MRNFLSDFPEDRLLIYANQKFKNVYGREIDWKVGRDISNNIRDLSSSCLDDSPQWTSERKMGHASEPSTIVATCRPSTTDKRRNVLTAHRTSGPFIHGPIPM